MSTDAPPSILRPLVEKLAEHRAARGHGRRRGAHRAPARPRQARRPRAHRAALRPGHVRGARPARGPQRRAPGEDEANAPADGVITGFGEIDGRMACCAAYDFTVFGGSIGEVGERKVARLRELALQEPHPDGVAGRLRRRAPGGVGGIARQDSHLRGHRLPLPRAGGDERRRAAGRGDGRARRRRHRVHPGPRGLRADGEGHELDRDRRAVPREERRSARRSPRRSSAARRSTTRSPASRTRSTRTTRRCLAAIREYLVVLPLALRGEAAAQLTRRPRRSPRRGAAQRRAGETPPGVRHAQGHRALVDDGTFFAMKPRCARNIITGSRASTATRSASSRTTRCTSAASST